MPPGTPLVAKVRARVGGEKQVRLKGKGKFGVRFGQGFSGRSSVPLDERKRRLAKLESQTICKDCGANGHWANDQQCSKKKSPHPMANLAVEDARQYGYGADEDDAYYAGEQDPVAWMAVEESLDQSFAHLAQHPFGQLR